MKWLVVFFIQAVLCALLGLAMLDREQEVLKLREKVASYQAVSSLLAQVPEDDPEGPVAALKRECARLEDELRAYREGASATLRVGADGTVRR